MSKKALCTLALAMMVACDDSGSSATPDAAASTDAGVITCAAYFAANFDSASGGLWRSDGTVQGTVAAGVDHVNGAMAVANGHLFVGTKDESTLWTLQRLDAHDATPELIASGTAPLAAGPRLLGVLGATIVFSVTEDQMTQLYASDGTAAGTAPFGARFVGEPASAVVLSGAVYFFAGDPEDIARAALWRTDGTEAGTAAVLSVGTSGSESPIAILDGALYFATNESLVRIMRSDGTSAGTEVVTEHAASQSIGPPAVFTAGDHIFYYVRETDQGVIYAGDGTPGNAVPVFTVDLPLEDLPLVADDAAVWFRAGDLLYRSGGTPDSTGVVTGALFATGEMLPIGGQRLLFHGADAGSQLGTWIAGPDRTALELSPTLFDAPGRGVPLDGRFIYAGEDLADAAALWITDGTPAGTQLVRTGDVPLDTRIFGFTEFCAR